MCTLAGLLVGLLYNNYMQQPLYKSNATLLVINKEGTADSKTTTINNYLQLVKTRKVLEPVVQQVGAGDSYDAIVGAVTATNDKGTEVIKLSIATNDPTKSKNMLDATIESFKQEVATIYKSNTIQVIDSANLPSSAYNVRANVQLALATAAGFLFSVIVLFFTYDFKLSKNSTLATAPATKTAKPKKPVAKKTAQPTKPKKATGKKSSK